MKKITVWSQQSFKKIKNATFWPFSPSWGIWPIYCVATSSIKTLIFTQPISYLRLCPTIFIHFNSPPARPNKFIHTKDNRSDAQSNAEGFKLSSKIIIIKLQFFSDTNTNIFSIPKFYQTNIDNFPITKFFETDTKFFWNRYHQKTKVSKPNLKLFRSKFVDWTISLL